MAKLFLPSVRCPNCSYANDSTFYFCQMCGYKRKRTPTNNNSYTDVNLETLDNRLKQLALFDQATRYAKQKESLQRELERVFALLPSSPTVMTATPRDICRFLVYKYKSGKTQVHKNGCIYLGKKGSFKCGCPLRLSYNTVDTYIGKLRAIFHAVGRRGEWDLRLGLGNPAADSSVKDYLRLVTTEQLQVRVTPRQATPFFVDK